MSAVTLPGTLPGLFWSRRDFLIETRVRAVIDGETVGGVLIGTVPDAPDQYWVWSHALWDKRIVRAVDLSLPLDHDSGAGMDIASRYLAERVGLAVGATSPGWSRLEPGIGWMVVTLSGSWLFTDHPAHVTGPNRTVLPGISALAACVLAVGGDK